MDFFCYHRERVGSMDLREELLESHWAYMDRFDSTMVARGPTFRDDGVLTGSVHILGLPDVAAARAFAFEEPCYQAGAYRDVLLRRWHPMPGRTDFSRSSSGYLVLGFTSAPWTGSLPSLSSAGLVAYGALLSDDASLLLGAAVILEDAAAATRVLDGGAYVGVEVHRWMAGGRAE